MIFDVFHPWWWWRLCPTSLTSSLLYPHPQLLLLFLFAFLKPPGTQCFSAVLEFVCRQVYDVDKIIDIDTNTDIDIDIDITILICRRVNEHLTTKDNLLALCLMNLRP